MRRVFLLLGTGIAILFLTIWLSPGSNAQSTQQQLTVLSSSSRTATTTSDALLNGLGVRGAYVILKVSGAASTPIITPSIQILDPVGGGYVNVLVASSGVTTNGTYTYLVYPGIGSAASGVTQVASFPLANAWRVSVAHDDTDAITYSVGAQLIQ